MEMIMTFPGGRKVEASMGGRSVLTDQPREAGGEDSAPSPFELFLYSLGACGAFYVLAFCQARDISTEGMKVAMSWNRDPETKLIGKFLLELHLPEGFPEKYRAAAAHAMRYCAVAKHLENPPEIEVKIA